MTANKKLFLILSPLLLLAGLTAWLGAFAQAEPPPPSFWEFNVVNTTGVAVTQVTVSVTHADAPDYESLPSAPTFEATIASLPSGRKAELATPNWYGAASITVTATCNSLSATGTISTDTSDFDGDGRDEYAGFCPRDGNNNPVFMGVKFLPPDGGGPLRMVLTGLSRWDTTVAPRTVTVNFN